MAGAFDGDARRVYRYEDSGHTFDVIPRVKSVEPMRDIRRQVEELTMGSRRDADA